MKLFLPNQAKRNLYNFTRYEYRDIQDRDTDVWNDIHRLRSRFGVEFPLTSRERAWQPKTWYGLADVEPYYRFDRGKVDPFRVRGGVGYERNDRIRMEFIYHAQFTARPAAAAWNTPTTFSAGTSRSDSTKESSGGCKTRILMIDNSATALT